jgi:predicted HicB family RNase H-like nuclease
MAHGKPGVPKGTVNNPKGSNQYACGKGQGQKNSRLELRLSEDDKRLLREAAQKQGMTLAGWLLSVAKEAAQAEPIAS